MKIPIKLSIVLLLTNYQYPAYAESIDQNEVKICSISLVGELKQEMEDSIKSLNCHDNAVLITSSGGDSNAAIKISNAIMARRASVKVVGYCVSACAEFVLPAAAKVIAVDSPIIGIILGTLYQLAFPLRRFGNCGASRCRLRYALIPPTKRSASETASRYV